MVITSFVIQKCYLTFNTVNICIYGIKAVVGKTAGSLVHRLRQWHQTVQVVMVFFSGMQLLFLRKNASTLRHMKKH